MTTQLGSRAGRARPVSTKATANFRPSRHFSSCAAGAAQREGWALGENKKQQQIPACGRRASHRSPAHANGFGMTTKKQRTTRGAQAAELRKKHEAPRHNGKGVEARSSGKRHRSPNGGLRLRKNRSAQDDRKGQQQIPHPAKCGPVRNGMEERRSECQRVASSASTKPSHPSRKQRRMRHPAPLQKQQVPHRHPATAAGWVRDDSARVTGRRNGGQRLSMYGRASNG